MNVLKKVKALIMTAVLVVGFTSVAGAESASSNHVGPCKVGEKFCALP